MLNPLGRLEPTDDDHIRKHPLTTENVPQDPTCVVWGVNWYEDFDTPIWDPSTRKWWIGRDSTRLGRVRGGHSVVSPPDSKRDLYGWYVFYNQGREGACVGFASSRAMSIHNRVRYDAHWLYKEAQKVDEWDGENYEGTSVRAAMDVLRDRGHCQIRGGKTGVEKIESGILANKWATTVDHVLAVLNSPTYEKIGAAPFLNSWGPMSSDGSEGYPAKVWVPFETWQRLLDESGEATMITDRV